MQWVGGDQYFNRLVRERLSDYLAFEQSSERLMEKTTQRILCKRKGMLWLYFNQMTLAACKRRPEWGRSTGKQRLTGVWPLESREMRVSLTRVDAGAILKGGEIWETSQRQTSQGRLMGWREGSQGRFQVWLPGRIGSPFQNWQTRGREVLNGETRSLVLDLLDLRCYLDIQEEMSRRQLQIKVWISGRGQSYKSENC